MKAIKQFWVRVIWQRADVSFNEFYSGKVGSHTLLSWPSQIRDYGRSYFKAHTDP